MTDLLTSSARRAFDRSGPGARRPLALVSALAGAMASTGVLVGLMAVGLAGWLASDAGTYGDTRDALRVGADAWLLGHGSHLHLETAEITVVPLGVSVFCGYVVYRLARWAGATSAVDDRLTVLTGTVVLAGVYAVVATLTGVLASVEAAEPEVGRAFLGAFLIAFVSGGLGIVSGAGVWPDWRNRIPAWLRAVGTGAVSVVLLMLAAGSLLLLTALLLDFGEAATVLSLLHLDGSDGLLYSLVVACFVPNAALMSASYLVGPGFMVGTGTVVSPTTVALGPLPAFPLLAALPDNRATPWWTTLLIAVPVVVAATGTALTWRRYPVFQYELGALRGLAVGVVGGVGFALLAALAGGSAGPGRMADVGVEPARTAMAAAVAMGAGAMLGAVWATWRARRRATSDSAGDRTAGTGTRTRGWGRNAPAGRSATPVRPGATRRPRGGPRPAGGGPGR